MPTEQPKTLARKLCDIMGEMGPIEKTGRNTMQNYDYVEEALVSERARGLFVKHGVLVLPSHIACRTSEYETGKGTKMRFVEVQTRYTFINVDDPKDQYVIERYGHGTDSGDKGLYKADTGCHKYTVTRTFSLGSKDDDPEHDRPQPRPAPRPQQAPKVHTQGQNGSAIYDDAPPMEAYDEPTPEDESQDNSRLYLRVPFKEKEEVKRLGARWDQDAKQWFVPDNADASIFSRWLI